MKTILAGAALGAALLAWCGCSSPTSMSSPRFTHMDVSLSTQERGKDVDTHAEFLIVPNPGEPAVASLDLAGRAFFPYTREAVVVPSQGTGFTLEDLQHEQIQVKMGSNAHGSWTYSFDAILHFSDGSEALISSGNQVLGPGRPETTIALSLASVASASAVGSVEKFAFGLLSSGHVTSTPDDEPTQATPASPAPEVPGSAPAVSPEQAAKASSQFASAPAYVGPLNPSAPTFTQMDLALTTRDRGMPPDTRLELSIVPEDDDTREAYLDVQGQVFVPNSTVQVVAPATGTSFVLRQLKHQRVRVKITPSARATWTYSFDVVLHFTNGSEALLSSGNQVLSRDNPQVDIPLSDATVASASAVGRMERYMFGFLSKGGGPKQGPAWSPASVSSSSSSSASAPAARKRKRSNSKEFVEMEVSLNTRNRGKAADTRLEFFIAPEAGDAKVAYLDIQGKPLMPYSKVEVVVPESGTGFTLDQLKHEQVGVRISPAGPTTWSCSFDVTLHFADGTQALLGSGDQTLTQSSPEARISLSDAMVASPSAIGGLEKFGFGLLK
jgi:hypothetical protein